jgi:rsbT co-antagonist protein RsbR
MDLKTNIDIAGINFSWDVGKGQFNYEGEDAVLFWISSAMKTFFDTIEEVSGEEATKLVLETTGFRQGLLVGEYFQNIKGKTLAEISELITETYATAGWGLAFIKEINLENKTLIVELKDDWEYKINIAQGKTHGGPFLAAHYAGIFSGLLKTNMWYKVRQYQIDGHDYSVIEYYPSDITVQNNIHDLARSKEANQIQYLEALVEDKTKN